MSESVAMPAEHTGLPSDQTEPSRITVRSCSLEVTRRGGRLRGALSQQLGEASRQLGARLHHHQGTLADALVAAVERGGALVAEASQQRAGRLAELDAVAATLQEVSATPRQIRRHHQPLTRAWCSKPVMRQARKGRGPWCHTMLRE